MIKPERSYKLNAEFEDHAEHEYMHLTAAHPELETIADPGTYAAEYGQYASVAELLRQIGHDERVHKKESLIKYEDPRIYTQFSTQSDPCGSLCFMSSITGRLTADTVRQKVWFASGGEQCAAWHYPSANGTCVVMAGGGGVTKEPGTDRFAAAFNAAGFGVLAFDYRHFGESGGAPRQVIRVGGQLADWSAAIAHAARLPGVDPTRIAAWSFSLSAGHLFRVAMKAPLAAAIAQSPLASGPAAAPNALRHETLGVILGFPFLAAADALGGIVGRAPRLVPLAGPKGTVAMLTTPDGQDGDRALNPGNAYPEWRQVVAARSVMRVMTYRPGRAARRVRCPMLVVVCTDDRSALAAPGRRAAARAGAELLEVPGGHYAPFLDQHERVVDAEIDFLRRQLGNEPSA